MILRRRQGVQVEFSIDRQGKTRQRHQHHRHHIGRQPVRQRGPQFRGIGSSGEVTDQPLVTGPVLAGDHNSLPNTI
ncbi:Uncharacterised protein [Mycobacteroides abscessus subsp. abscessus]|nr:Uncharacterised protein [Mycobacteroides abscessus subsp. abscessus]